MVFLERTVSRYCWTSAAPNIRFSLSGSKEYNQEKAVFGVCILVLILGTVITLTSRRERNPNLEGSEEEPLLGKHRETLKTSDDNEPEMIIKDNSFPGSGAV